MTGSKPAMIGGKHQEPMKTESMMIGGKKKTKKSRTLRKRKTAKRGRKGGNANGIATIGALVVAQKLLTNNKTLKKTLKNVASKVKSTGNAVKRTASKMTNKVKGLFVKK